LDEYRHAERVASPGSVVVDPEIGDAEVGFILTR
jgi:hypothetical protein